jgi:hypothetical protein
MRCEILGRSWWFYSSRAKISKLNLQPYRKPQDTNDWM